MFNDTPVIPAVLDGDTEIARYMQQVDWEASPLGEPAKWPQSLRVAVRLMLNTQHPVYIFWGKDAICLYNDAYRHSIGNERHPNSIGRPGQDVWEEIWPIIGPQIDQVMTGGGPTWHENQLIPITRNGCVEDVYWTYSYSPIDDDTSPNGIGGVLVLCTETTNLVKAERRSRDEGAKTSEFLAVMSHELRNPMNAVVGLTNLLAKSSPLTNSQRIWLDVLQASANSLVDLINRVLDLSALEASRPELEVVPFRFTDIIEQVAAMISPTVSAKELTLTGVDDCIDGRVFMGDPNRLRQILLNLCGNAAKFTKSGGIHLEVTCEDHPHSNATTVLLTVSDTGIGIPKDRVSAIFDKYAQGNADTARKFGGTGLGLAITKALVEAMDGTITVQSAEGAGSTFLVSLPLLLHDDGRLKSNV